MSDAVTKLYTTESVITDLEDAAAHLLLLPLDAFKERVDTSVYIAVAPILTAYQWDFSQPFNRPETLLQPARIDQMNERLMWIERVPQKDITYLSKTIIRYRIFLHPLTERNIFSWRWIASHIGCDIVSAQKAYDIGIAAITKFLNDTSR